MAGALRTELDTAQQERHAKVHIHVSSCMHCGTCISPVFLFEYTCIHTTYLYTLYTYIGGIPSNQPTGEQAAQETDLLAGKQGRHQVPQHSVT